MKSPVCKIGRLSIVAFGLVVFAALASGFANAQQSSGAGHLGPHAEGKFAPVPEGVRAQAQRRLPQSQTPAQVVLDHVEAAQLSIEATAQASKPGVPLKIGFSRDVPQLRTISQASALMVWTAVPGGQLAAISITSPDALGVRLGLVVERLPATAVLRFYAQGADQVFEVSGQEIMDTIARNLAAGDKTDEARTYWSPVIDGQEITVEIELPAGASPAEVMISIPRVSHLFSSPLNTRALQEKNEQAAACNLDSMCYQPTWGNQSLATAKMTFTSGGSTFLCTGTLVNDNDTATYIPYFLSANHCISAQTEASSLQTYWFYRASSCNSGSLSPNMQTLSGGATLLYASSVTDTSFLRLNGAPPGGVVFSGWTANLPALSTLATGVHHPTGDLQKISFGAITDYRTCPTVPGSDSYSCTSAPADSADHLKVIWSEGTSEGGSSGSGLWITSGSSHYLVGQLHGGSSTCLAPTNPNSYGRFDLAYNAALYQWLGSGTNYALSVSKTGTGSGTVTSSPAGISCGATCSASYSSGTSVTLVASPAAGSNFTGWSGACTGTASCIVSMSAAQSVTAAFAAGLAAVSLIPTSLSFAAQVVGTTSAAKTVTLTNTGGAVLTIGSIVANGAFALSTTCGATLANAASCAINVTFKPTVAGFQISSLVVTSNAPSSPNTVSLSGTATVSAPVCTLIANPASIFQGGSSTLTASCSPTATSYGWTGGTCAGTVTNSCTVTPNTTTYYLVFGSNSAGTSNIASKYVTVIVSPPIYSGGLYEGIYQWAPGMYLTIQQHGTHIIATNYFNADGSFSFNSPDGHVLPVPQLDLFDLYGGPVTGANATISGTEFHRACNVSYNFAFSDNGNITVTKTAVSNTAAATQADISCSAITMPIGTVLTVPKILF